MNHNDVQLIGVFPTANDTYFDPFVYSVDAPTNLWISCRTDAGTMMSLDLASVALNRLLDADGFTLGAAVAITLPDCVLTFTVGEPVDHRRPDIQAFRAQTATVRVVSTTVAYTN